jgi:hypothetical protein
VDFQPEIALSGDEIKSGIAFVIFPAIDRGEDGRQP